MDKNWIYYGVFFSSTTRDFLIRKAKELIDIQENWTLYGDHMTIVFNDGSERKQEMANALDNVLGYEQQLRIISI